MTLLRKLLVAVSAPLVVLVVVGALRARTADREAAPLRDLKVFSDVVRLASQNYVDPVDFARLERGAYLGLAESLDPWSSFVDPERMGTLSRRDQTGEVGLLLFKLPQQYVQVAAIVPGSPADAAGLRRGEGLETIEGLSSKDMSLVEAQALLAGPPGTSVTIGLFRRGDEEKGREVALERKNLAALRVVASELGDKTAVLRVTDMRAGVSRLVQDALARLAASGVENVILDLRHNVGGTPDEAARTTGIFTGPGPVFQRKSRKGTSTLAAPAPKAWQGKLAVLVGRSTVGEAELVAAALQAAKAGTVLGQRTFGKHTEQDLVRLSDGSGLWMSVAEYLRADGTALDDEGLVPDEEVAPFVAAREEAPEPEEADAAEPPIEGAPAPPAEPSAAKSASVLPPLDDDPQVKRAREVLAAPAEAKKAA